MRRMAKGLRWIGAVGLAAPLAPASPAFASGPKIDGNSKGINRSAWDFLSKQILPQDPKYTPCQNPR